MKWRLTHNQQRTALIFFMGIWAGWFMRLLFVVTN